MARYGALFVVIVAAIVVGALIAERLTSDSPREVRVVNRRLPDCRDLPIDDNRPCKPGYFGAKPGYFGTRP